MIWMCRTIFRYVRISICHSLLRKVILSKIFGWYFMSGRCLRFISLLGDFTRNWTRNLLSLYIYSPFHLFLSLLSFSPSFPLAYLVDVFVLVTNEFSYFDTDLKMQFSLMCQNDLFINNVYDNRIPEIGRNTVKT